MLFSTNRSQSILNVQSHFNNEIVAQQIALITLNYNFTAKTITKLEEGLLKIKS